MEVSHTTLMYHYIFSINPIYKMLYALMNFYTWLLTVLLSM